jgi:maltose-binding protein MalE
MRHSKTFLTGALALTTLLTACSNESNRNTLTIWHAWGGAELSALKTLMAQYRQTHPGVEIMALQVPYDRLKDKYLRSAAANGGPDLLIGDADWSGKFAAADLVLETDKLFTKDELSRFMPGSLTSLTLDGKMYAIPESRETIALYYNKRLVPTPPTTVSDMFAKAASVQNVQYGMVFNSKFYYAMGYYFGSGGKLFDDQDHVAVNSPESHATFNLFDRMSRAKGLLTSSEYMKGDSLYKEGQTAMIVNGPWALVDYQKKLGKDLGVAMLPKLDNGHAAASWVGVKCMMFNSNSDADHRQMAKDFALFMTSPESQKVLCEQAGHIPSVKGVKLDPGSPLSVFQAQADVGTPVSIKPEVSLVWEPMDKALEEVTRHQATTDAALSEAETVIKAKIAAMRAHAK